MYPLSLSANNFYCLSISIHGSNKCSRSNYPRLYTKSHWKDISWVSRHILVMLIDFNFAIILSHLITTNGNIFLNYILWYSLGMFSGQHYKFSSFTNLKWSEWSNNTSLKLMSVVVSFYSCRKVLPFQIPTAICYRYSLLYSHSSLW